MPRGAAICSTAGSANRDSQAETRIGKALRDGYLEQSLEVVKNVRPLSTDRIATRAAKARQAATTGKYELLKTTSDFNSTAKNPAWLG